MQRALLVLGVLAMFIAAAILAIGVRQMGGGAHKDQTIEQKAANMPSLAGQILGKNVQNQEGKGLGRVVALSTRKGNIAYILVSRPGGRDWIPVPPGAAHLNLQQNAIVLKDVDEERMAAAPTLDPDEPQILDDPYFESEVRSYYGMGSARSGASRKR